MTYRSSIAVFLLVLSALSVSAPARAELIIRSQTDAEIDLIIYNGLGDSSLFKGSIAAQTTRVMETSYSGLALLVFSGGQSYPVILGDEPLTMRITTPDIPPSFPVGSENEFFYKLLAGATPAVSQYGFALLMIQAKELLESSHNIHTTEELSAKKKELHEFVGEHYDSLKHSDMVRRLIAQYFMMHEYVNYHTEGAPATDIRVKYQQAVLNGVEGWLVLLKPHIADHEILNYITFLYYNRSMVSLASVILAKFRDIAYCPGEADNAFNFSNDLLVIDANSSTTKQLGEIRGNKIIAFVSDDCPVSMVETVNKARKFVAQNSDVTLIVAPLQRLSETHLSMGRMISGGNLLFIKDDQWTNNLGNPIKLPLFHQIRNALN